MKKICILNLFLTLAGTAFSLPDEALFLPLEGFPQPAPGSFSVVGSSTTAGQFLIWDGDQIFLQDEAGGDLFLSIAAGYQGDPAFLTLNPAGDTALLGQGFGDGTVANLYLLDLIDPADFVPGDEIQVPSHFSGVYLSDNLIALDRGDFGFPAEIIVLDLSTISRNSAFSTTVLEIPEPPSERVTIVTKPPDSFSASLAIDNGLLYVADSGNGQYKTFLVADIITAFNTSTTVAWTSGTDVGSPLQYPLGGVAGFSATGNLVIAGFGSIVEVVPFSGTVADSIDPAGTSPFYGIIYNNLTTEFIPVEFPAVAGDPLIFYATINGIDDPPIFVGRPSSGGGCLIATAAYDTPLSQEIDSLRALRDQHLMTNALGTAFVDTYYRLSPPIADRISTSERLKGVTRLALHPLLWGARTQQPGTWIMFAIGSILLAIWTTSRRTKKRLRSTAPNRMKD